MSGGTIEKIRAVETPEGTFTIGELVRRNRPAMGVQP